ncbi:type I methionyl aminopeptidase [Candidatus Curtissbacteria bacterium RIFCSPHIGHO2_01_FULL_41_44]|uniref:Methionine aminopeptidase n=1 Tax=Candidatus Curtissbacteria bacterium RIFCSPLOWO2_01_FULL_42_50 TaxID=1797730 RepID=A0A1F5H2D9_9BACT|nr:MAG: type I methionyl aminopeptidase [Candidatus Curtissbacteria bacterium RIFCSPHIGHO2_02_FULL_42_58]OGD94754.1 MAG: type I methionyl aminopeptidase [Candidatus Curtissbacteria bacterium RIFCSPHIGHO2_01_FULL_41_44]OGD96297.1 MAG: type I methionyl aminopeptidase [Candidatus Curtissbacteria bacterium RIFCSPHIGHO2_12_FULL_42_33]OGD98316.1 MAG: type I methionyl aminopeptidase [Candidatus Curtissbacteria bacterium RIFCSPLOWO2_01_FULL_42_50]OGE02953.1 MAG: type I methionyl aminopeptidase [Candida
MVTQTESDVVKTDREINLMKISGKITALALKKVLEQARPGVSCDGLDQIAKHQMEISRAQPSFMTVDGYKWTICTTVNQQVVHGVPTAKELQDGDILGIDVGASYRGFHTDMAKTVAVGNVSKSTQKFLEIGHLTLKKAISQAVIDNRIGDISSTIQGNIEGEGFSVVKSLTGHGIGRQLHEEPLVPGFGKKGSGPKIVENMVLAIEVIYAQGSSEVRLERDGWTISTKDGSLAGLYEQTVAVTRNGPIVLTPYL